MKYDGTKWGRESKLRGSPSLREEWAMARALNESHPGSGEWVPKRAVWVRDDVNPRENAHVDAAKVGEYAEVFFDLPPILVQKDTFALIDGNHRLRAAFDPLAGVMCIRVQEVECSEEELRERAFDANAAHGVHLSTSERVAFARYLVDRYPAETDGWIAKRAGIHRNTVMGIRHRAKSKPVETAQIVRPPSVSNQTVPEPVTLPPPPVTLPVFDPRAVTVQDVLEPQELEYEPEDGLEPPLGRGGKLRLAVEVLRDIAQTFTAQEAQEMSTWGELPSRRDLGDARAVLEMAEEATR